MPNQQPSHLNTHPPKPEQVIEAVHCLLERLPVGDRYLVALVDLIEGEYARRARSRRRRAA